MHFCLFFNRKTDLVIQRLIKIEASFMLAIQKQLKNIFKITNLSKKNSILMFIFINK